MVATGAIPDDVKKYASGRPNRQGSFSLITKGLHEV